MNERTIYVTGNSNKAVEARSILPFDIQVQNLEIEEIQGEGNVRTILAHKLHTAFEALGVPVIAEDVSAELASLNGMPGPFIKFFEKKLGRDALYKLSKVENDRVKIICCMGYYDGKREEIVEGIIEGTVVAPRGNNGFGFDAVIVPDGHDRTMAEMSLDEKNGISHRNLALKALAKTLETL